MHDPQRAVEEIPRLVVELFERSHYSYDAAALPYFAAAAIVALAGAAVAYWERGSRMSALFGFYALLITGWTIGGGLLRLVDDPGVAVLLARNSYALTAAAIPFLYHFFIILLRIEDKRRFFARANWAAGAGFAMAAVGSDAIVAGVRPFAWGLEPVHGMLGAGFVLWLFVLAVFVLTDLYRSYQRTLPATVERRRVRAFALAVLFLCATLNEFLPATGVALRPFGFATVTAFILITAYITRRYGLTEVTVQLAAQEIAAISRGALLILDRDGIVRVVNQHIRDTLGLERAQVVGRRARDVLGDAAAVENLALLAHLEGADVEKEIPYPDPRSGQMRDLALSVVAVKDPHAREVAYVCAVRDITEQRRSERERLREGLQDTLTRLPNRAMFLGLLDAAVERARQSSDYAYAVCFLGLDRMRIINEDLGYAVGDQVLTEVAARLRKAVRPQDAVARVGGDEFALLIRGPSGLDEVRLMVDLVKRAIQAPLTLADHNLYLVASVGVATSHRSFAGGADLLRSAGVAMYRAKEEGGGGVHFVAEGEAGGQRTRLEAELRAALERDQFHLYYQPVIDLQERRVAGFEALIRWQHPQRGLLLPGEFVEFAEEIGLIGAMDRMVLHRACADVKELQRRLADPHCSVSINLSENLLHEAALPEQIRDGLSDNGLEPAALRVEVLERVARIEPVRETLSRLRRLGLGLYVDDFGTGYSALSRLHELPVSALKIDRDFVRAMSLDEGGEKIIAGIIALARSLGLEAIAEGCSVAEEVVRLRRLGCRYVQGFYFSKGLPLDAAAEFAANAALLKERFDSLDRLLPRSAEKPRVVAAS